MAYTWAVFGWISISPSSVLILFTAVYCSSRGSCGTLVVVAVLKPSSSCSVASAVCWGIFHKLCLPAQSPWLNYISIYPAIALPFGTCLCGFKWATCDTYLCRVHIQPEMLFWTWPGTKATAVVTSSYSTPPPQNWTTLSCHARIKLKWKWTWSKEWRNNILCFHIPITSLASQSSVHACWFWFLHGIILLLNFPTRRSPSIPYVHPSIPPRHPTHLLLQSPRHMWLKKHPATMAPE